MKAIIIDDELNNRVLIRKLLATFPNDVNIVEDADNVDTAYQLICELKPDFIFLDIQMPGGNGFELLKKFNTINFEIVFITSFNQYAIQSFKFSAVDYLLKPLDLEELKNVILKVSQKIIKKKERENKKILYLINNLECSKEEKSIALNKGDKVILVKVHHIELIEADSNYCLIKTIQGSNYIRAKTLRYFEHLLLNYDNFLRVTKSTIVNLNHIVSFNDDEPCILQTKTGMMIEVSRRKRIELVSLLKKMNK